MLETKTSTSRGYFDFSTIFKATKLYVDGHNKVHFKLTTKLNANHRATAELMVRLYAKQLNKAIALGENMSETLPGFKTFNSSLASCKGCTKRTIMNHKERLKAAGFITKEVHRGKAGIELWINSAVFSPIKLSIPQNDKSVLKNEKTVCFDDKTKKIHPLVHVPHEQKNNNSNVDKLITTENYNRLTAHESEDGITPMPKLEQGKNTRKSSLAQVIEQTRREKNVENQTKKLNTKESKADTSTRKSSAPDPISHTKRFENTQDGRSESAFLLKLVIDFWGYAKTTLYKNVILSTPEESEILNHIWASVYKKFNTKGSLNDWTNYQELLYNRIDMVAKYLERDPKRWVALPHFYFDPENTRNGFDKTYKWFLKQELLKKNIRNQILVQTTEKEWQDHDKSKGRHKHKTRLQLFLIQQQRLGTYSDEQLMRNYKNSVERYLLRPRIS